jgi:predicted CXXCH cytochrome family protein
MTRRSFWAVAAAALVAACSGEDGAPGPQGATGDTGDTGPSGPAGGEIALQPAGVVGFVSDTSGAAVTGGTVYFVPAADVKALAPVTMPVPKVSLNTDPNVDRDEPLEDLIRLNGTTYAKATVGTDGVYSLATLPAGSYFVTFVPVGDAHLPGGSLCRVARSSDALVGTRLDVEVSPAIPAGAEYVGSGKCISCHGRAHIASTMHRLGIWSPYESGVYQDIDARKGDLHQALNSEFTAGTPNTVVDGVETVAGTGGTRIYFYDFDGNRGFDKYKTARDAAPATALAVSFSVRVYKHDAQYWVEFRNEDGTAHSITRRVDTIYGGGVKKQRYQTKVMVDGAFRYSAMLPLQFNSDGVEGSAGGRGRTAQVWRDYYGANWYDRTAKNFVIPAASKSFEKNCISCHAAGVQVTGSDSTTWTANLVSDPVYGDFDYDGDGVKDEMNMGCETCHGPGSRHWESAGQGKFIVSPSLLTPERETMLCGQCHSRPQGGLGTDSPVNTAGWMMIAGTSRAEFLASYATTQGDGKATDFWGAQNDNHSKSHHQQYSDFIRSAMYRNDTELMTCATCHDPHRRDNERQLRAAPTDNAALCGSCHATQTGDVAAHALAKGVYSHGSAPLLCTDCHMPKTAQSGAGAPPKGGTGITGEVSGTKYWFGDISSHMFDMPRKSASKDSTPTAMPTAYMSSCVNCHTGAGL